MLRILKILLVLSVAAWAALGAIGNFAGWKGTMGAVAAVASMSTFPGGAQSFQATTNPAVIFAGALFIPLFKIVTALLCLGGAWRMFSHRKADADGFAEAKTWALAGCAVAVFNLFFGWIVIGEGWFEMWRSAPLQAAGDGAFRYGGFIALIALLVGARDQAGA